MRVSGDDDTALPSSDVSGGTLASGVIINDRYRVIERLGAGGMGAVYLVQHQALSKRYALKLLHPQFSTDPHFRERFRREGLASARIKHPNVVEVLDVGRHGAADYLLLELLQGESLRSRLDRAPTKRLSVHETLAVMLPVMAGVYTVHEEHIVHRDIKPENILLAREGRAGRVVPKVLDFGIAKVDTNTSSGAQTQTGMGMGTPGYMPPEQMNAKDAQPSADQFALGVTLYECLTGERPPARHIIAAAFDRPSVLVPELPREIDDVIVRMLQPDPDKRYADLREVVRALAPFADAKTRDHVLAEFHEPPMEAKVPVTPATAPERPLAGAGVSRRRIRRVLAIAAVAAVAAGAVALSVVSSGTRGESPMETAPGPSTQNVAQPDLSAVRVTTAVGGTGAGDVALTRAADVENPPGPRARPQPRAKTTKVSPTRSKETVVPQGQDLNRLLQ